MTTPSGNDVEAVARAMREALKGDNVAFCSDGIFCMSGECDCANLLAKAAIAALNIPALIRAEREACAKIADPYYIGKRNPSEYQMGCDYTAEAIADAIRARKS